MARRAGARIAKSPPTPCSTTGRLKALAAALPTGESALAAIPGIGPVKLEAYGPELTAIFEDLRSQQPISP